MREPRPSSEKLLVFIFQRVCECIKQTAPSRRFLTIKSERICTAPRAFTHMGRLCVCVYCTFAVSGNQRQSSGSGIAYKYNTTLANGVSDNKIPIALHFS